MLLNLKITLVIVSLFLIFLTTYVLKRGRIPEKYSLLWYAFALLILLVGIFPELFDIVSKQLGFKVISNLIIGCIIGGLIILTMALTVMMAGQKKKTILLIQEISLLKNEIEKLKKRS